MTFFKPPKLQFVTVDCNTTEESLYYEASQYFYEFQKFPQKALYLVHQMKFQLIKMMYLM